MSKPKGARQAIQEAVEALGAPVLSYAPKTAMREYDAKIVRAVQLLLYALNNYNLAD